MCAKRAEIHLQKQKEFIISLYENPMQGIVFETSYGQLATYKGTTHMALLCIMTENNLTRSHRCDIVRT